MTTGRATREQLEELHRLLALHLLDTFRGAAPGTLKASLVNVARAFLADNAINVEGIQRGSRDNAEALASLIESLPDFEPLERHKAN